MQIIQSIQNSVYELRGKRIMLNFDLALLYEVETTVLNQSVKRNINRFPEGCMFQLSSTEWEFLQSQPAIIYSQYKSGVQSALDTANMPRSQNVTLETGKGKHRKYLPFAKCYFRKAILENR